MLKQNEVEVFPNLDDVFSFSNPETIGIDFSLELVIKFVVPGTYISQSYSPKITLPVRRVTNERPVVKTLMVLLMILPKTSMTLKVIFDSAMEKYFL